MREAGEKMSAWVQQRSRWALLVQLRPGSEVYRGVKSHPCRGRATNDRSRGRHGVNVTATPTVGGASIARLGTIDRRPAVRLNSQLTQFCFSTKVSVQYFLPGRESPPRDLKRPLSCYWDFGCMETQHFRQFYLYSAFLTSSSSMRKTTWQKYLARKSSIKPYKKM